MKLTKSETKKAYVNDNLNEIRSKLNNINWDFSPRPKLSDDQVKPFDCRTHHWFPATFIPEIPFSLIEIISRKNALVFDPFGGIGTTFFQALILQRKPLTTEICKVSIEYMKSLFKLFNKEINYDTLLIESKKILNNYDDNINYIKYVPNYINVEELVKWYHKKTFNKLCYLFSRLDDYNNELILHGYKISISAILKKVSSQERGWGCVADNVIPKENQFSDKDVFNYFKNHFNNLIMDIKEHVNNCDEDYISFYKELSDELILYKDIREFKKYDNCVDLIVSSPPYPNMTDYVKSQRLSYYFYGFDIKNDLEKEIGARAKRNKKSALDNYYDDMLIVNKVITNKIKPGGYLCYILPNFNTDNVNNTRRKKILQQIILDLGKDYESFITLKRRLPAMKRSHNTKWVTVDEEQIDIFRKL